MKLNKKYLPQEIEVWYVIPSIRRELAKAMANKGLNQKKIASILGVTGAAVSQYISQKRAKEVIFLADIVSEIEKSAEKIMADNDNLIEELQRLLDLVKKSRALCTIHHKYGTMPLKCEACMH
jgi:hypothetical protein